MTTDKAIERLETFVERHPGPSYSTLIPAIQLSIEALQAYTQARKLGLPLRCELLPSETTD